MAIGTSRLEGGGSSGAGGRGRGAGADGRLRGGHRRPSTREDWWREGQGIGEVGYLDNGRVLGVGARRFGRLAHSQVLDVAASEDDVLEDVLARWDGPIGGPVLGAKGADWWGWEVENVNVLCLRPCIATTFIRQNQDIPPSKSTGEAHALVPSPCC